MSNNPLSQPTQNEGDIDSPTSTTGLPPAPLPVIVNGHRYPLLEDGCFSVTSHFLEGTLLFDAAFDPPKIVPLNSEGITIGKLRPHGHYTTSVSVHQTAIVVHNLPEHATSQTLGRFFESLFDDCFVVEADIYRRPPDAQGLRRSKGRGYVMLQNVNHTLQLLQTKQLMWDKNRAVFLEPMDWRAQPPPPPPQRGDGTTPLAPVDQPHQSKPSSVHHHHGHHGHHQHQQHQPHHHHQHTNSSSSSSMGSERRVPPSGPPPSGRGGGGFGGRQQQQQQQLAFHMVQVDALPISSDVVFGRGIVPLPTGLARQLDQSCRQGCQVMLLAVHNGDLVGFGTVQGFADDATSNERAECHVSWDRLGVTLRRNDTEQMVGRNIHNLETGTAVPPDVGMMLCDLIAEKTQREQQQQNDDRKQHQQGGGGGPGWR